MGVDAIVEFLENKSILLTGAAGFLAKIFTEKILRVQPNVNKLYLLLRASDPTSAVQRFNSEVVENDLFRVVREKYKGELSQLISEKVRVICGDISSDNLGIKDSDLLNELWEKVDVVLNLAATTKFDERYDVSFEINTMGAIHVLDFSKRCTRLQILVHVSTAYVAGEKEGLILEKQYKMGETLNNVSGLDIFSEKKLLEETLEQLSSQNCSKDQIRKSMKELGIQRARKFGWPNTYVFTKAMGEMLLGEMKQNVLLVIIRPAIVTSTLKEPFPGWIEGVRTVDSIVVGYGKGKLKCILANPKTILDVIPGDMVVNAIIVSMVAHAGHQSSDNVAIYHVGSSKSNPMEFGKLHDYVYRYFTRNPWMSKDGEKIIVGRGTVLTTIQSFQRYMAIRYIYPLKALEIVNAASCRSFQDMLMEISRKVKLVMRLVDLYEPYMMFKGVYDDANTKRLIREVKEKGIDTDVYYFDPTGIDWESYFMRIHNPGAVKYLF